MSHLATSLGTPKPYAEKVPSPYSRTESQLTVFIQPRQSHKPSIVTPEYPKKEVIYTKQDRVIHQTPKSLDIRQSTLGLTTKALALSQGVLNTRVAPATLAPRPAKAGSKREGLPPSIPLISGTDKKMPILEAKTSIRGSGARLNKFVRRLHDMLRLEKDSGVVEWRRGLLVLYSTDAFAKKLLPKYFNTRNFKTFRRQLNYYGFVHVRSFSTTGSSTTALWVNRDLATEGTDDISSVLKLKRVEPCDTAKTAEGRRQRKEQAIFTVEEDIGVSAKTLQLEQIRCMALRGEDGLLCQHEVQRLQSQPPIPQEVHVVSDHSGASSSCGSNNSSEVEGLKTTQHSADLDEATSTSAANVLLMLSKA